jgi:hypothetical protein
MQLNSDQAILLYPSTGQENTGRKGFAESLRQFNIPHSCEMYFIELFNGKEDRISEVGICAFLKYLMI